MLYAGSHRHSYFDCIRVCCTITSMDHLWTSTSPFTGPGTRYGVMITSSSHIKHSTLLDLVNLLPKPCWTCSGSQLPIAESDQLGLTYVIHNRRVFQIVFRLHLTSMSESQLMEVGNHEMLDVSFTKADSWPR
jgi:hypothetical protein